MSESSRAWRFYLDDMIEASERVLSYTHGLNQPEFEQSRITYDATVRNLELLGEAARHIPSNVREAYPAVPWRLIVATRNRLIHGYLGIDNDVLWSIISDEVPLLLTQLEKIKKPLTNRGIDE